MFAVRTAALGIALFVNAGATYPAETSQIMAESRQQTAFATPSYADIATRSLGAPAIVDAVVRDARRLKPAEAPGVAPGRVRYLVTADVSALIRGADGLAQRIFYLADVPLDARGKPPRLKKARVLLFARPVAGMAGDVQLTAPDGQLPWTPALDAMVRAIARDMVAPDAPPAITGVGNAFHVPGTLPGESETQIFLTTADARPVSLSILRRPGETTRWAVALSEIVDDAAAAPRRDTLLWYRLACGLPPALPDAAIATMPPEDGARAQEDYQFVRRSLGPCR
ncbi:hypothetical protein [Sphingomonas sp. RS2018]